MTDSALLPCDGCGQPADSAHIARRLQRLEWATRFRPVHIQALLLGAIAPEQDADFLYAPQALFRGDLRAILEAAQITAQGKSAESILGEFQKLGLALAYILECPLNPGASPSPAADLLEKQLPAAIARIRRSLKPRRVLLFSNELSAVLPRLHQADLGCPVLPPAPHLFLAAPGAAQGDVASLRQALGSANAHSV